MTLMLLPDDLQTVVDRLRADGRTVVAPVRRDGIIAADEITGLADLPTGWVDEHGPGQFRLAPTDRPHLFGQAAPGSGWKHYLYPERTLLVRARRGPDRGLEIEEPVLDAPRYAFMGIRSCDVLAIGVLDRVLMASTAVDPTYAARRADVVVLAVTCEHPGATCFCASMGTGPVPPDGVDVRLTELVGDGGHRLLAEPGTDRGRVLLDGLGQAAAPSDLERARTVGEVAVARMGRHLDPAVPALAGTSPDHPYWDDVASRCLACASCTMVCPTCFCSTTEDRTDLGGTELERWRRWDSCFSLDFSWANGAPVRPSIRARYRQWLLHKLVTWHDQYGTSGCVGCGRCITWCPVGIDLTTEIVRLADAPAEAST